MVLIGGHSTSHSLSELHVLEGMNPGFVLKGNHKGWFGNHKGWFIGSFPHSWLLLGSILHFRVPWFSG